MKMIHPVYIAIASLVIATSSAMAQEEGSHTDSSYGTYYNLNEEGASSVAEGTPEVTAIDEGNVNSANANANAAGANNGDAISNSSAAAQRAPAGYYTVPSRMSPISQVIESDGENVDSAEAQVVY